MASARGPVKEEWHLGYYLSSRGRCFPREFTPGGDFILRIFSPRGVGGGGGEGTVLSCDTRGYDLVKGWPVLLIEESNQ